MTIIMQLSSIAAYLEKYRQKISSEDDKRNTILEIIKKETGITIDTTMCTIHKGVLKIEAHPVIKNELFLYKEKLLRSLKEFAVHDIH